MFFFCFFWFCYSTTTAWVGSIPIGFCCICSPLIILLIERFGSRAVVATGTAISAAGIITTSFMPSLTPMYFSFSFAYGLGAGMMMFGCLNLIHGYFPFNNSTRATVMPMACGSLGNTCIYTTQEVTQVKPYHHSCGYFINL